MNKVEGLYIETIKNTLIDLYRCSGYVNKLITSIGNLSLVKKTKVEMLYQRINGLDWPDMAESMIGLRRMENIQVVFEYIMKHRIEGDILDAGVWRGGSSIFIKALLTVYNSDKTLYVCDSFCGLPKPEVGQDEGDRHYKLKKLSVSLGEVKTNFFKYGFNYLSTNLKFVEGWFKDTMPPLAHNKYALIRLDGDMYKSTMDVLENIYDSVVAGGVIIIDDYALKSCRDSVTDFRKKNDIKEEIIGIDGVGVYWIKNK